MNPRIALGRARAAIRCAAVAIAASATLCATPALAATSPSIHRDSLSGVPAQTLTIGTGAGFRIQDAQFTSTSSSFSTQAGAVYYGHDAYCVVYDGAGGDVSGSFSLKWQSLGTDADGDPVDVAITISNIYVGHAGPYTICESGTYNGSGAAMFQLDADGRARYDMSVRATKHGTDAPASGTAILGVKDLDQVGGYGPEFAESVELLSGYGPDVYLTPDCTVSVTNGNRKFTATAEDYETYRSGFVTTYGGEGISFRWRGGSCGTDLLEQFSPSVINASAGTGGSISSPGDTTVYWKNDKEYQITASDGYRVRDVTVDGASIGAAESYSFEGVTSNHSIHAEFQRLVNVTFTDGLGRELSHQVIDQGADATAPAEPTRRGYLFDGWDVPYTNVQDDLVVNAKWKPVRYTVRFLKPAAAVSGSMDDQEMTFDQASDLDSLAFSWEGHAWEGWDTERDGSGTRFGDGQSVLNLTDEDGAIVNLYAQWRRLNFPCTFTDGRGTTLKVENVPWSTSATAPDAPTWTGHAFLGWDRDYSRITEATVVNATWSANGYAVSFDANGGTGEMADEAMTYDVAKALDGCAFTRPGHTFRGWATSPTGPVAYEDSQEVVNLTDDDGGRVTLYAVWEEDAPVEIRYHAADPAHCAVSSSSDSVAPATGTPAGSVSSAAAGYHVTGWVDAQGAPVACGGALEPQRGNDGLWHAADYYANVSPNGYAVSFDANGGTGEMADEAMTYDVAKALDGCAFSWQAHRFCGWNTMPDGSGDAYEDSQSVLNLTEDDGGRVTLYAQWAEFAPVSILYKVSDPAHGSVSLDGESVLPMSGAPAGSTVSPDAGYRLVGWYDEDGKEVGCNAVLAPTRRADGLWHAVTYTARIEPVGYKVAFDGNGADRGRMGEQAMTYDVAGELSPNEFRRVGHTFLGWNTRADGTGDAYANGQEVVNLTESDGGTVTLYAQWRRASCTVTFVDGQGNELAREVVAYGEGATAPADPKRDGYEFKGWDVAFSCVTNDLVVTAQWEPVAATEPDPDPDAPKQQGDEPAEERADEPGRGELAQTGSEAMALAGALGLASLACGTWALRRRRDR